MTLVNKNEFITIMQRLNIYDGDIVFVDSMLDSNLSPLIFNNFLNLLIDYLGDEGSIVMSLDGYNYDLNKKFSIKDLSDENKEIYLSEIDISLFASDTLAVHLLNMENSHVSSNPFYPYVAYGKYANLIINGQSFDFSNGINSPLATLDQLNAKAILINHDVVSFKLNKYVFESSPYSIVKVSGGISSDEYKSFLDKQVDLDLLNNLLEDKSYKQLFYYSSYKNYEFLSVNIREYGQYVSKQIKEKYK